MPTSETSDASNERASKYLAIDPGETLGWATFDAEGTLLAMGQNRYEDLLEAYDPIIHSGLKQIICEKYENYGHKKQPNWKRNITSEVIGKLEMLAELRSVPFYHSRAANYPVGAAWGGFSIPTNHSISHQFIAVAHGIFWLQQNGVRPVGQALLEAERAKNRGFS